MPEFVSAEYAAAQIKDGDTIVTAGSGPGHAAPGILHKAIGQLFQETGHPNKLSLYHASGIAVRGELGIDHFADATMLQRHTTAFLGHTLKLTQMALEDEIPTYIMPQGVLSQLMRAIAAGLPGYITPIGLHTFVDPRLEGGRYNPSATDEMISLITVEDQEYLLYKSFPVQVALLRGTTADARGNITVADNTLLGEQLAYAQAAHNSGGIVIVQVKEHIDTIEADPKNVRIPGALVDYIVVCPEQEMGFELPHEESLIKQGPRPTTAESWPLNARKLVARRAAMELKPGNIYNVGFGMPDGVPQITLEEGLYDQFTCTIEQGGIGGMPALGEEFGAMHYAEAFIQQHEQFDLYHGGGLDIAFLGMAEADAEGNVNVSRFGPMAPGCGGFIDISQSAKRVVFCGTFIGGSKMEISDGKLVIHKEGKFKKFVQQVQHRTFSGMYALEQGHSIMYLTERALFELRPDGVTLVEISPGIDLQKDILDLMEFTPIVADDLRTMPDVLFNDAPVNLAKLIGLEE